MERRILGILAFVVATEERMAGALAQEAAKDVIATQVRAQRHLCESPESAKIDESTATPGEQSWILRCKNATYWVKLIPHRSADIKRVEEQPSNDALSVIDSKQWKPHRIRR